MAKVEILGQHIEPPCDQPGGIGGARGAQIVQALAHATGGELQHLAESEGTQGLGACEANGGHIFS